LVIALISIENEDKLNTKAAAGKQTIKIKRFWKPEVKMKRRPEDGGDMFSRNAS
jgi:hypothetical protein